MLKKILLLFVILVVSFGAGVRPAAAQGSDEIYVDSYRDTGNEDGSKENPYNEEDEGRAYLQALPYGGDLYIRNEDGTWNEKIMIASTDPGISGIPLPKSTLYALLALFAVGLMFAGWYLQRHFRQVQS